MEGKEEGKMERRIALEYFNRDKSLHSSIYTSISNHQYKPMVKRRETPLRTCSRSFVPGKKKPTM